MTSTPPDHAPSSLMDGIMPRYVVLAVIGDADVRAYVLESLRRRIDLRVEEAASVLEALQISARRRPTLLVADEREAAIVRHLPGIPAVLLADDAPLPEAKGKRRVAPLVVLRGAFRPLRLLEVVGMLLENRPG